MHTIENAGRTAIASATGRDGAGAVGGTGAASAERRGQKARAMLRATLGEDIFTSWFNALEFDHFDGKTVRASVPVRFLKNWIQSHYSDDLLKCCRAEFKGAERGEATLRQPAPQVARPGQRDAAEPREGVGQPGTMPASHAEGGVRGFAAARLSPSPAGRPGVGGFEGSPLDPRYT